MISYYARNYGANANGRNGDNFWEHELEESDEPEILEQLEGMKYNFYEPEDGGFYWPDEVSVWIYSKKLGEGIEFKINPMDYL